MLRPRIILLAALLGLSGAFAHADLTLISPAPSRSVTAEVTYSQGNVNQTYSSSTGGTFNQSASESQSSTSGPAATVSSSASQNSTAPPDTGTTPSISGMGNVSETENIPVGSTFTDGAFASSDYTVNFTVSQTGLYLLTGTLSLSLATASDIGMSSYSITDSLVGLTGPPYSASLSTTGTTAIDAPLALSSLDTYTLTFLTDVGRLQDPGPSSGTSTAGWSFAMSPLAVPEPASVVMVGLGAGLAVVGARAQERRRTR